MQIRKATPADRPALFALWNDSCHPGEVVYKPLSDESFARLFERNPSYDGAYDFVCEENGEIVGFITGAEKKEFLPGETRENTPGYLTAIFVRADHRRRGIGGALLAALEDAFRAAGKKSFVSSGNNPVNLPWFIPGTPGHDHNNAPGTDVACAGYPFLLKHGYRDAHREVSMYLNLKDYVYKPEVEETRQRLLSEGIYTGRYDVSLHCEFDGMCDRVGS